MNKILQTALFFALSFALVLSGSAVFFNATVKAQDGADLHIIGDVTNPIGLTMGDIQAMPKTYVDASLYCGGILISEGTWGGVTVVSLLQKAGANPYATNLMFIGSDGYTKNIALGAAVAYNFIVAYELNGDPVPEGLRLILPNNPGNLWVAWIATIKVTSTTDYDLAAPYDGITLPIPPAPTNTPTFTPTIAPTQSPILAAPPSEVTTPPAATTSSTQQPFITATPEPTTITPTNTPNATVTQTVTPEPQASQAPENKPSDATSTPTTPAVADTHAQSGTSSGIGASLNLLYVVAVIGITVSIAAGLLLLRKKGKF